MGDGVAKDPGVDSAMESFDDGGGGLEVHIGDPEGFQLRKFIPFEGACTSAIVDGVKVIHGRYLNYCLRDY